MATAASLMCECSHHWSVHAASGQTAKSAICHGYTGSATPGPLREPCSCTSFRAWSGPRDARTGQPVKPVVLSTPATSASADRIVANQLESAADTVSGLNLDDIGEDAHALANRLWKVAGYLRRRDREARGGQ